MNADWEEGHVCTLADHLEVNYDVPLGEACRDADFLHLYEESQRLCSDPAGYADRLRSIANRRLTGTRFVEELDRAFETLRTHFVEGAHPHLIAEALQIVVSDLPMIEEVADYGAPQEVVAELCDGLVKEALFIADRLVLNTGRHLGAKRKVPPPLDEKKVQPLERVLGNDSPELRGSPDFDRSEPVLVVATAGRGTRLRTTIPKALLPLAGRPFLGSIVDAARRAGIRHVVAVVKHRASLHPPTLGPEPTYVVQEEALGTAHSFATALRLLVEHDGPCVLSYSDTPFLTSASFRAVLDPVAAGTAVMSILAVATEAEPEFGRLEESAGRVRAILQPRFGQQGAGRADGGLYACRLAETLPALLATRNRNHRYEYSFTEVVAELNQRGHVVTAVPVRDPREVLGVNRPADLILARRLVHELQADLDFFRRFSGTCAEALSPPELLELSNRSVERIRASVGAVLALNDPRYDRDSLNPDSQAEVHL
ncbi:MAG: NTP transferase domain-containing protein [bacterium]|nr:NTP transferase domain-containing protein [bacterium]